jgi:hypothetical protein
LKKITALYLSLFTATIIILASCMTQPSIYGLWQDTNEAGTIEFKTNGEVIIIDNMSATVTGTFTVRDNELITFELTATDIMSDSIQPMTKTIVTAKIIKFDNDELQLRFAEKTEIEHYKRVR